MTDRPEFIGILTGGLLVAPLAVEGQNIRLEYRFAETRLERFLSLAAELVDLKVDVIFAINSTAAQAALKATKTIPIVFTWIADPLSLVTNLARPGGNITGLTTITTELSGKRVELLKDALPGISRIAVLSNSANPSSRPQVVLLSSLSPPGRG
jgi:putative ABC transport system substrate-binding protein